MKTKYVVIISLFFLSYSIYSKEYKTINCVLHIHSEYSGAKCKIDDIVNLAKQNNIEVVVLTDHLLQKVEFGLWPFRGIIKKSEQHPSILSLGAKKYLDTIKNFSDQKDLILIAGAEVTPHYFWVIEDEMLVAKNLHKHILVLNFTNENQFFNLPVIHVNLSISFKKIFLLSVLILFTILSLFLKLKIISLIFFIIFIANLPLKQSQFNQYKNYNEKPYQNLIDYANNNNLITIWAHPEAINYQKKVLLKNFKKLKIATQTEPYYNSLIKTSNYDGFSIFAEGYKIVGKVGGIWDLLLKEYLEGKRKKPVWCYSEVDFGDTKDQLYFRKNILYVKEKTYKGIINALKNGNFYSLWRNDERELIIEILTINTETLVFGNLYYIDRDKVNIEFSIKFSDNSNFNIKVYIIRNGEIVFFKEEQTPTKIFFTETKPKGKNYYRIFIESYYPHMIATNPIFIE